MSWRSGWARRPAAWTLLVWLVPAAPASADALNHVVPRGIRAAQADCALDRPQGVEGQVVVMEHDGSDYGWKLPDGTPNYPVRECVARRFYQQRADAYDFIVVYTNFEFETGSARAFYNLVRNDVRGLGKPLADNGSFFGSPGRLKGYVDMAALSRWLPASGTFEPGDESFASALHVLAHEVGHQWLAQPRYRDSSGALSSDLLGRDGSHWSYLLDSDGSHMYGADWVPFGPGRYRAERVREAYSPLDLYLMGLLPPERTPEATLLRSPGVDPTALPLEGAEVVADAEQVAVADVVAAEGLRQPNSQASQKEFRLGFVLLVRPGSQPTTLELQAVERLREAFQGYFFTQTRGIGLADTTLAETPPGPPLPAPDLEAALGWLVAHQTPNGRWEDLPGSGVRDTSLALEALDQAGQTGAPYEAGRAWLAVAGVTSTDFLARRALALAQRPLSASERTALGQALLLSRQADGGFGPAPAYGSTALDTALALRALRSLDWPADSTVVGAVGALAAAEVNGGGFAAVQGRGPSTLVTAETAQALLDWAEVPATHPLLSRALQVLLSRRNPDGGFGESPSSAYATALALRVLSRSGLPQAQLGPTVAWLKATQRLDGSWGASRYETALVLGALRATMGADLLVPQDSLVVTPARPREGQAAQVSALIKNVGRAAAGSSSARLYLGAPPEGQLLDERPVPALEPGAAAPVDFTFETLDHAGTHTLFVVADAAHEIEEAREDDNVASTAVTVEGLLPDLELRLGGIQVSPDPPVDGEAAQVVVTVHNRGEKRSPAGAVLRLVLGNPRLGGRVLGDAPIPAIEAGQAHQVTLTWDTTGAQGQHLLYAVADATYVVSELDEANNESATPVEVVSAPPAGAQLALAALVPDPGRISLLPQAVTLTVQVKNLGLTPATTSVAVYDSDPPSGPPVVAAPVSLGPRQSQPLSLSVTVSSSGTRSYVAVVDPEDLIAEEDESDNLARTVVVDPGDTVDLELQPADVTVPPGPLVIGDVLTVTATVRNRGTAPVHGLPVTLNRSLPDGGAELDRELVDLAPGAQQSVVLSWTTAATGSPLRLTVRVDPFGTFPELDEGNNDVGITIHVQPSSLPNLRVSGAEVTVAPDPPLQGGAAAVAARVTNAAVVPVGPFVVELYRGEPGNGGAFIGQVDVPGLAPGEGQWLEFAWSPVDLQGASGLFVLADPENLVEEFDEEDNEAFRPLAVVGLPDLSLTTADVVLEPPFPHEGQLVQVHATVRNLGPRPAGATVLRIYEGQPPAGSLVGEMPVPALEPLTGTEVTAGWTPAGAGEHPLYLLLDPDGTVAEGDEGNNLARVSVVVQDADLYLTAPYFSPDGDGTRDDTTLAWRAQGAIDVVLSDSQGHKLRDLAVGAPGEGSVTWDGRDETGRVVADGEYTLSLVQSGAALARATAVLDTNRLPIHAAAGTGLTSERNLTCALPSLVGPAWMPAEDAALLLRQDTWVPEFPPGLLRVGLEGEWSYLFQDPWFSGAALLPGQPVSPDGRELLLIRASTLYAVDLTTGGRRQVADLTEVWRQVASWSPDGQWIALDDRLLRRDGEVVAGLPPLDNPSYYGLPAVWSWSPDSRYLARVFTVVDVANPGQPWTAPVERAFTSVETTEWRGDGSVYTLLNYAQPELHDGGSRGQTSAPARPPRAASCDPEDPDCQVPRCDAGCSILYRPFGQEVRELPWITNRLVWNRTVDWSPGGERVGYARERVNVGSVTEVASEDGLQALELSRRVLSIAPRKSLGYQWSDEAAPAGGACQASGASDLFVVTSLENLSLDFHVARLPGNSGLLLVGVAADRYLESWQLEYASASSPVVWRPIGPASEAPVLDDVLTAWVPPAPGTYAVRLSASDLAGNRRSRTRLISWDRYPSITNITQTEFLISPTGDGVKDEVRFDYFVQEPTRVDVRISGPLRAGGPGGAPPLVRASSFDHPSIGARSFTWDGRDEQGVVVADGRYEVALNEVPLRVEVDSTPPDVAFAFRNLQVEAGRPGQMGEVRAERAWHVVDRNLRSWRSPVGQGTWPQYDPVRDEHGDVVYDNGVPRIRYESGHAADLVEAQHEIWLVGALSGLTMFAEDRAGNRSAVPVPPVPEKLFVAGAFDSTLGRLVMGAVTSPPDPTVQALTPDTSAFRLYETATDTPESGEEVRFQFQSDFGGAWNDGPAETMDRSGAGGLLVDFVDLGLDLGSVYRGRFVCQPSNGSAPIESEVFQFRPCQTYMALTAQQTPEGQYLYRLHTAGVDLGVAAWLSRPCLGAAGLELPMHQTGPGDFELALGPAEACPRMEGFARVLGASGQRYDPSDESSCLRLRAGSRECEDGGDFRVSPLQVWPHPQCGGDPDRLKLSVRDDERGAWIDVQGDPDGAPFPIGGFRGTGSLAGGLPWGASFSVAGRPHGELKTRLTKHRNPDTPEICRTDGSMFIDRILPRAEILQPAEGAALCVSRDAQRGTEFIPLAVSASDDGPAVELVAQYRRADESAWHDALQHGCASAGSCPQPPPQGVTAFEWDVTALEDGDYVVQFTFCDRAGNRVRLERRLSFSRLPPRLRVLETQHGLFSPNGDGRAEQASVQVRLDQAVELTVRVYASTPTRPLLRTVLPATTLPGGDHGFTWDGRSDGGGVVPDGRYVMVFHVTDGCGSESSVEQPLEVDNTPPLAVISSPAEGATVAGAADVRGVAADRNLSRYELASTVPGGAWTVFGSGQSPQGQPGAPVLLQRWLATPGEGPAALRLAVLDKAENAAEALVDVVRAPPLRLGSLTATPAVFSHNGDGRRESTALEYVLLVGTRVTLDVRDASGVTVRRLVNGLVQEAGAFAIPWDGLSDAATSAPDGEYQVVLTGEAPEGGGAETAEAAVVVDRLPPAVAVSEPGEGTFVDHDASVVGSVEDLRLSSFVVTVRPPGGSVIELARGNSNQALSPLAGLSTLTDGPYTLAVEAEDQAENRAQVSRGFVLDSVGPIVAIHSPANGAVLPKGAEPQAVLGAATDANLREWVLRYGPGADPAYFVEVRRSATGGFGIPLGPWATSALADGTYTLELTAEDRAGHQAGARTRVDLDGTRPEAAITTPAEGQCLRAPAPVAGRATDVHLERWDLEWAPGPAATAYQWSPVASGVVEVEAGPLADWDPLPSDGAHTLRLTARDAAGLERAVLRTVTVDTVAPPVPADLASQVRRTGQGVGEVVLTWAVSSEAGVGYRVTRDGQPLGGRLAAPTFTDVERPEGLYLYRVVGEDGCGNASEPASLSVRVDVTPPLADILTPLEGASVSGTVEVRGTAWSADDFKGYRLLVGSGLAPSDWMELRRSTLGVLAGPLGSWTALGEGPHTLALEAEDSRGNLARAERHVVVDNLPPAPPILVSVEPDAQPAWLLSTWTAPPDQDVEGYLVYRNGRLANATGIVIGELRPYLVPGPGYLDRELPDGHHCYHVVAMDHAGNLSTTSNTLCRTLQNRPPQAEIVQPAAGTRFDHPLRITALSPDLDVVRVQFQYKAHDGADWAHLGPADTQEPWETTLDPAPLAFGEYDLRAVATDAGNLTDPAPAAITVVYGDATPPMAPLDLVARADAHDVRLVWTPSAAADVLGYHVYLDGARLTTAPVQPAEYQEQRALGRYTYTVTAVDADGNESPPSNQAAAQVYAVTLEEPFPVTLASQTTLGGRGTRPGLTVQLRRDGTLVATTPTTGETFSLPDVPLQPDGNVFVAQASDAQGDRSVASNEAVLIANTAPGALGNLAAAVDQRQVTLSWDASPESDLFGYALRRDGQPLTPTAQQTEASSVSASSTLYGAWFAPQNAFDGSPYTYWLPYSYGTTEQYWQVDFPEPVLVERVEFDSVDDNYEASPIASYRIEAAWEGRFLPLAVGRQNDQSHVSRTLPSPFATQSLRIVIGVVDGRVQGLAEVRVFVQQLVPNGTTSFVATDVPDGHRRFEAAAVDRYGADSPWVVLDVPVGDVTPPAPPAGLSCVAEGSDAVLTWNANGEPDFDHYVLFRDGTELRDLTATAARDERLPNGVYNYALAAVDALGNRSALSAAASCTIAVVPPEAPVLQALALPNGLVRLEWTHPGASTYVLSRSNEPGGPYTELVRTPGRQHVDATAAYDVRHYYVVRALDQAGNASPSSNEASAVPLRTEPPAPPVILFPSDAAHPTVVEAERTPVRGRAEPGTVVSLSVSGQAVGSATTVPLFTPQGATQLPTADFVLDPSGRRVAYPRGDGALVWRDLASGVEGVQAAPGQQSFYPLSFSPDGRRLLCRVQAEPPASLVDLAILDLADLSLTPVEYGSETPVGATWSPDGTQVVFSRTLDWIDCPLWSLEVATGLGTALFAGPGCASAPQLSPDGTRVAFQLERASTSEVVVQALNGGPPAALGEGRDWSPAWSPDGQQVAFYTTPAGGAARVRLHDLASGTSADVTDGLRDAHAPTFAPDGQWLAWHESFWDSASGTQRSEVVALHRATGTRTTLATGLGELQPALRGWTQGGYAAVAAGAHLDFLPGFDGAFEFPEVPLQPGVNLLVARARDPRSGTESSDSLPVQVQVPASVFPDLAVSTDDLRSSPLVPRAQQPALLGARVHNRGGATAHDLDLHLRLTDSSGQIQLDQHVVLSELAGGGEKTVWVPWTPQAAGTYGLRAVLDEASAIREADETNNAAARTVTVVAGAGLVVSLVSDRPSYPDRSDALAFATLVNGGPTFDGAATVSVVDGQGHALALLDQRPVHLAYGEPSSYVATWNTGTTYAGAYAFELRVVDQAGAPAGLARSPFVIEADLRLGATLRADTFGVPAGDAAVLHGTVANLGVNAPRSGLEARLVVLPEGSTTLVYASAPLPLPTLLPQGTWQGAFAWPVANPPGRYVAELRVGPPDAAPAAIGRASFEVLASGPVVTGTVEAVPDHVLRGAPFTAEISVTNPGSEPLAGYPLLIEVVAGPEATVVASQTMTVDLAAGQTLSGALEFPSAGLAPGRYSLRLRGGAPQATLARAALHVHGLISPPSIDAPPDGATVDSPHPLLVVNNATSSGGAPLAYEFELYLDPGLQLPLPGAAGVPEGPARTSWRVTSKLNEDAVYFWRARATDGFSQSAWSQVASFRVDASNLPPAAPVPDTPEPGARVGTRQPALVVANASDPEFDVLTYDFRLAADAGMATVLASATGLPEGPGLTAWNQPLLLDEDGTYWWSARAFDGRAFSSWSVPVSFRVDSLNLPPGAPTPLRPVGGARVPTLVPELVTGNAADAESDGLTYRFELDVAPSFDTPELQVSPGVREDLPATGWVATVPLRDDTRYYWRASASDGHASGPWASASFFVDLNNDPPGAPLPVDPVDGRAVPTNTPTLAALQASDPEGDPLTYGLEVADAGGQVVAQSSGIVPGVGQVSWTVTPALQEDQAYTWRARAHDPQLAGPWSAPASFRVNAVTPPPGAPALVSPAEGSTVAERRPPLMVSNAASPESLALTYTFELYADGPAGPTLVDQVAGWVEGAGTTTWTAGPDLADGPYTWRARATDSLPQDGPWMNSAHFTVAVDVPPAPPLLLVAVPGDARVTLTWHASPEPDVVGYRVYRGLSAGGPYAPLADSAAPSFLDIEVVNGTTYFYVVAARDAQFESGLSNEVAATPQGSSGLPAEVRIDPATIQGECLLEPACRKSCPLDPADRLPATDPDDDGRNVASPRVRCPQWLLATVELPAGQGPGVIDRSSLRLAGQVPADPGYAQVVDSDGDGQLELEVRFAFEALVGLLEPGPNLLPLSGRTAGGQAFSGSATVTVLPPAVSLRFTPRTLQLSSQGQQVQAQLQVADCLDPRDISPASLRLNETVPIERVVASNRQKLIVKFDRAAVAAVLPVGDDVEIRVSGTIRGRPFVALDYIRVVP